MYINSGTMGPGNSEFSLYKFNVNDFVPAPGFAAVPNAPPFLASFSDPRNGQSPGPTLQRDAHGMALVRRPFSRNVIHQFDRVQDSVDVFGTDALPTTLPRLGGYSLRSSGVCGTTPGAPVVNGAPLTNKPSPDLADAAPYGNVLYVALRGPAPITVAHAAVGSCPGLGIIRLDASRTSGTLIAVFNTTLLSPQGINLSDNHMAVVIRPFCQARHTHNAR